MGLKFKGFTSESIDELIDDINKWLKYHDVEYIDLKFSCSNEIHGSSVYVHSNEKIYVILIYKEGN